MICWAQTTFFRFVVKRFLAEKHGLRLKDSQQFHTVMTQVIISKRTNTLKKLASVC